MYIQQNKEPKKPEKKEPKKEEPKKTPSDSTKQKAPRTIKRWTPIRQDPFIPRAGFRWDGAKYFWGGKIE